MLAIRKISAWAIWYALGALLLVAVGVLLTQKAWQDVADRAIRHEEASHIFLVAIAVPWLIWARREKLRDCQIVGTWIGPLIVVLGWAFHVLGYDHQYDVGWHGGTLLIAIGCFLSFFGRGVLFQFLPVFFVLGFLCPVPGRVYTSVSIPLQTTMAAITEQIGQVLGFAIDRSGNVLIVAGRHIEIAEACNGMRMVFGLFLSAYIFAFAYPLRWSARLFILITMPIFALLCNIIRMIPTVWLFGHAPLPVAEGFHDAAGYLMIVVAIFMLVGTLNILRWAGVPVFQMSSQTRSRSMDPQATERRPAASHEGSVATNQSPESPLRVAVLAAAKRLMAPAVTVLLLIGLAGSVESRQPPDNVIAFHDQIRARAQQFPKLIGQWYGEDTPVPNDAVQLLKPNVLICRLYENVLNGQKVTLLLVQCRDASLLEFHYPPTCYAYAGWKQQWAEERQWQLGDWSIPLTEYGFEGGPLGTTQIVIANFMLLPTGEFGRGMDTIHAIARHPFMRLFVMACLRLGKGERIKHIGILRICGDELLPKFDRFTDIFLPPCEHHDQVVFGDKVVGVHLQRLSIMGFGS